VTDLQVIRRTCTARIMRSVSAQCLTVYVRYIPFPRYTAYNSLTSHPRMSDDIFGRLDLLEQHVGQVIRQVQFQKLKGHSGAD